MVRGRKTVGEAFSAVSAQYDSERRQLIPCFDAFYRAAVAGATVVNEHPVILDLGAGTGILSHFVLQRYPLADLTLMDMSPHMLEHAKKKLGEGPGRQYHTCDYTTVKWGRGFDLIVSALSIHHLNSKKKRELFEKIHRHLKPGGCFVNADQVRGETPFLEKLYKQEWFQRLESGNLPRAKLDASYDRMKYDREDTLAHQLKWLAKTGLTDVGCLFQWYGFAVMLARKASA